MPAMIFLCEQCGEKELFAVNLVVQQVFDKSGSAPICLTPQCGRELTPVISMKIAGVRNDLHSLNGKDKNAFAPLRSGYKTK